MILLLVFFSIWPLSNYRYWVFRFPQYFAVQWVFIFFGALIYYTCITHFTSFVSFIVLALLVGVTLHHFFKVLPHTVLGKHQVPNAAKSSSFLSIISCNILQHNRSYSRIIDQLKIHQPDLFIGIETDKKWGEALESQLDIIYPYKKTQYQDDTYGMVVFSKFEIVSKNVFKLYNNTPTMHLEIMHPQMGCFHLIVIHPKPPSPTEASTSLVKDAELNIIAADIAELSSKDKVLVVGDLNDVPWSRSSRRFLHTSGLKDPLRGRKLLFTFPTYIPFMGFPLDQFFVSPHFSIGRIFKLPKVGSDHFPVYFELALNDRIKCTNKIEEQKSI